MYAIRSSYVSGPPLMPIALGLVYRLSEIAAKPIIGVGGISSGIDAVKFLMAGASLVQVCTAARITSYNVCYTKLLRLLYDNVYISVIFYNRNCTSVVGKLANAGFFKFHQHCCNNIGCVCNKYRVSYNFV